ncbi:DUF1648 domain-containing protein [Terrisporobacter petrolearius]|uniref:DUF5808 domain-containing protein n=1 Tax=Terrisporobacter petrolearius TaxID=1460447 RepID=UPI001D167053|nr:DUF5808 domain-containing protein [Terrisporobacter petrolearius]MCC3865018.1 DUF1648 domain-containing protein [Terrisporobacter petrolearius]
MFFLNYIVFILIILFTHLIALSTQSLSSRKYFFGVYINEIIIEEDLKVKITKDFKRKLNVSLFLSIMVYLILKTIFDLNIGANIIISTTVYLTLFFLILTIEYKKVKYVKDTYLANLQLYNNDNKEQVPIRVIIKEDEILANEKKRIIKKFKILFGICIILSLVSFVYVLLSYKNMPDTIITHWGAYGKPNGYSKKNILNVFFTSFIDISMVLLFAVIGIGSVAGNTYIDNKNLEVNRKKAVKYLNGIGYSFLTLTLSIQSITSTIPIFMVQEKDMPMWLTIGSCIIPIFIVVPVIYFYLMLSSIKPKSRNIYTIENDDEKWIYGFIYYNKEDPKLMVEKRLGMGWSINMAHTLGKVITIILVLITVGSLLICFI